jgi:hypothetical protein
MALIRASLLVLLAATAAANLTPQQHREMGNNLLRTGDLNTALDHFHAACGRYWPLGPKPTCRTDDAIDCTSPDRRAAFLHDRGRADKCGELFQACHHLSGHGPHAPDHPRPDHRMLPSSEEEGKEEEEEMKKKKEKEEERKNWLALTFFSFALRLRCWS